MTASSQSGTIDGIGYASSKDVYDTLGYGVVTRILYLDQSGNQVAERDLIFDLGAASQYYGIGPKTPNADGTFSVKIVQEGGSGIPQGYSVDLFSSDGIMIRQDAYTPNYVIASDGTYEGYNGYSDSYTLFNSVGPGSGGTINGAHYDTVETLHDSSGQAT
jgi:hypothetical protein